MWFSSFGKLPSKQEPSHCFATHMQRSADRSISESLPLQIKHLAV